jgi:16S rRNA processing protein RimM
MPVDDDLVLMGRISEAHGLKGEVKIASFTADPVDLAAYGPLTDAARARRFEVLDIRPFKSGTVVARLKGVSDRTAAEKLRGVELFVPRVALPETEDDEFYYSELIGLAATSPDGETMGEIVGVHNFGAGDLLEIRPAERGATWLVPFTQARAPHVDIKAGIVVIVPEPPDEQAAVDVDANSPGSASKPGDGN